MDEKQNLEVEMFHDTVASLKENDVLTSVSGREATCEVKILSRSHAIAFLIRTHTEMGIANAAAFVHVCRTKGDVSGKRIVSMFFEALTNVEGGQGVIDAIETLIRTATKRDAAEKLVADAAIVMCDEDADEETNTLFDAQHASEDQKEES